MNSTTRWCASKASRAMTRSGGPEVLDKNPDAAPRGWIKVPAVPPELKPDSSLFILQHPKGDPLKLAIDTNAIIEVKYRGSPRALPHEHRRRIFRLSLLRRQLEPGGAASHGRPGVWSGAVQPGYSVSCHRAASEGARQGCGDHAVTRRQNE